MTKKAKEDKVKKEKKKSFTERYLAKTNTPAYLLENDDYAIREFIDSGNYALNALLSASWKDGGYPTGRVVQLAGPNSVGKTYLFTEAIKQAQKLGYIILMIDSEFGSDASSWIDRGIDPKLFIHLPIYHIKQITREILMFIEELGKNDKAIVVIDSVGNLSSDKETEDIVAGKGTADMTRAKELKAMFRQLVVPSGLKNVPIWIVNHEYQTMALYSTKVQGGGTGPGYGSSIIVSMTKSKEKKSKDGPVIGTGIRCIAVKNRFAKEQSVVSVVIDFDHGLSRYSGLFALAVENGLIWKPKNGYWTHKEDEAHKISYYANNIEFWEEHLSSSFGKWVNDKFKYQSHSEGIFDSSDLEETGEEDE